MQGQSAVDKPIKADLLLVGECDVVEALSVQAVEFFELFFRDPPLVDYQGGAGFEARPRRLRNIVVAPRFCIDARKCAIRIISFCHHATALADTMPASASATPSIRKNCHRRVILPSSDCSESGHPTPSVSASTAYFEADLVGGADQELDRVLVVQDHLRFEMRAALGLFAQLDEALGV
jgi:hypothetical protein